MSTLPLCMSMHHVGAWCLKRAEDDVGSPGIGETDNCEQP